MKTKKREWSAVNRFSKRGPLKGCWLKDPHGKTVATVMDSALAGQIAAAMNLTTQKERIDYSAERAGFVDRFIAEPNPDVRAAQEKVSSALADFKAAGLKLMRVARDRDVSRMIKKRTISSKEVAGSEREAPARRRRKAKR